MANKKQSTFAELWARFRAVETGNPPKPAPKPKPAHKPTSDAARSRKVFVNGYTVGGYWRSRPSR